MKPHQEDPDSPEYRRAVLESYIALFDSQDAAGLVALFAEDAIIEDPVGKPARQGQERIAEFFSSACSRVRFAAAESPVRGSLDRFAVVPLVFVTESGGAWQRVSAIDVMEFNATGEIVHMRAFHGPEDRAELSEEEARTILTS